MKFFWFLADFWGVHWALSFLKEILNYLGPSDMLSYIRSIVGRVINLRLYCMVDVTNIDILKPMWNSWRFDMFWKNLVNYNSSCHIKVLHVTAMFKLLYQLQNSQILNMTSVVSLWCLWENYCYFFKIYGKAFLR